MINSSKLLSRDSTRTSPISSKVVANIVVIRRDSKKIDDILKERLVLSKVRSGILKQQEERDRRKKKENEMETDESPKQYEIDQPETKKRKGFGGFIGAIFNGLMSLLGGLILRFLPQLIRLATTITKIVKPFVRIISSTLKFFSVIAGGKIFVELFKSKNDFDKEKIQKGFKDFRFNLNYLAAALVAYATASVAREFFDFGTRTNLLDSRQTKDALVKEEAARKARGRQLNRFGADDVIREGKRVTKEYGSLERVKTKAGEDFIDDISDFRRGTRTKTGGQIIDKEGDLFKYGSRKPGELKKSREILKRFNKAQAEQLNLFRFLDDEPTRISDADFKNLRDFTDGKISADSLDERILRGRKGRVKKIDLDKVKLGNVRQQAEMTNILDKFLGTKSLARKTAKKAISPIIEARPGEVAASKKILENFIGKQKTFKGMLEAVGGIPLVRGTRGLLNKTLGRLPFGIGDLLMLILDIVVFKEPVGRAAFMAIGGVLGGLLGAMLAGVITVATGGTGIILTPLLSIIGGISGDFLGGLFYDLLGLPGARPIGEGANRGIPVRQPRKIAKEGGKRMFKAFDLGGLVGVDGTSIMAKRSKSKKNSGIDPRILELYPDLDPTKPGDYIKLKRKSIPMDLDLALRDYAYYEKNQGGRETMIPIPIPVTQTSDQQSQTIVIDSGNNQKSNTFSTLYRRG